MIEVKNIVKKFDDFTALDNISVSISNGGIFGMVGSNGAGKSTLMRCIAGIYKPEAGEVLLDGEPIFENVAAKSKLVYVGDELYTMGNSSMDRLSCIYEACYPDFDRAYFEQLKDKFGLDGKKSMNNFSKGMKRQAIIILALSCRTDYIMFDETFDGLDPVMRNLVKELLYKDIVDRGATAIITSHSLRELEDICDQLALLHKGGLVLQSEVGELKSSLFKCQVAYGFEYNRNIIESYLAGSGAELMHFTKHGSVANLIVNGNSEIVVDQLSRKNPLLIEVIPLSLEEIFTYEMALKGYSFEEVINGQEGEYEK